MSDKENLLQYLYDSRMLLNDGFSLTWLRIAHQDLIDKYGLGGGNFLIALGCFATLNFASKVYWILEKGFPEEISEENQKIIRTHISGLPSKLRKLVEIKSSSKINETAAFVKFVNWYNTNYPNNSLGLKNSSDSEVAWKAFRDTLSHMGFPKKGFTVGVFSGDPTPLFEINPKVLREKLANYNYTGPAIIVNHEEYEFIKVCNPDILVVETEKILTYLIEKISALENDNTRIKDCIKWIETNYRF